MTPRLLGYPNRFQNSLLYMHARTDYFKYSFFPSSIEAWNSLHLMLQQELIVTSCIRSLRLDMLLCCCLVRSLD